MAGFEPQLIPDGLHPVIKHLGQEACDWRWPRDGNYIPDYPSYHR